MLVSSGAAYILHKRPYRETSQIIEVFSRDHGRVCLMSKGSRGARSRVGGLLQPFRPLLLGWQGRGEMPTLRNVDAAELRPPRLGGRELMSAFYLNELIMRLLHRHDVHEALFDDYHAILYALQTPHGLEIALRTFEKKLLQHLGFGLNLERDADSGDAVRADAVYSYRFEHGPVLGGSTDASNPYPVVAGDSLLAFAADALNDERQLADIKRLMRYVISNHLGGRKLKSRELFRGSRNIS
jgi:DNA repair protein RecO (recombination protein O)